MNDRNERGNQMSELKGERVTLKNRHGTITDGGQFYTDVRLIPWVEVKFDDDENTRTFTGFHDVAQLSADVQLKRDKRNAAARARRRIYADMSLKHVRGNMGGTYYE